MSLLPCRYVPTGRLWTRLRKALFQFYVNVHHRMAERQDRGFFVQLDNLEAR